MPFCTECGHENPPSAKFCSQCGHRLVGADTFGGQGGGQGGEQGDATSTITFGAVEDTGETSALSAEDAAARDLLARRRRRSSHQHVTAGSSAAAAAPRDLGATVGSDATTLPRRT